MASPSRCLLLLTISALVCRREVGANVWRKSLQKELLVNSIAYLRRQLFTCLKVTDSARGKRKVANDWYSELRLQMDLDILENSENYLFNRVIECRMKLTSGHVTDDSNGLDHVMSSSPDGCQNVRTKTVAKTLQPSGYANSVWSSGQHAARTPPGRPVEGASTGHTSVRPTSGYAAHSSTEHDVGKNQIQNETESTLSTVPPTDNPTTQRATTTHKPDAKFLLDGQYLTCDTALIISNTFQCRNLRINGQMRLPNMDYCPPRYDVNRWRSMDDMSDRTRDAIDLLDLCATLGQKLNVSGYTTHVRVVWQCDRVTPRLKWQNGRWAGMIKDNGFLHDLECSYSAAIYRT